MGTVSLYVNSAAPTLKVGNLHNVKFVNKNIKKSFEKMKKHLRLLPVLSDSGKIELRKRLRVSSKFNDLLRRSIGNVPMNILASIYNCTPHIQSKADVYAVVRLCGGVIVPGGVIYLVRDQRAALQRLRVLKMHRMREAGLCRNLKDELRNRGKRFIPCTEGTFVTSNLMQSNYYDICFTLTELQNKPFQSLSDLDIEKVTSSALRVVKRKSGGKYVLTSKSKRVKDRVRGKMERSLDLLRSGIEWNPGVRKHLPQEERSETNAMRNKKRRERQRLNKKRVVQGPRSVSMTPEEGRAQIASASESCHLRHNSTTPAFIGQSLCQSVQGRFSTDRAIAPTLEELGTRFTSPNDRVATPTATASSSGSGASRVISNDQSGGFTFVGKSKRTYDYYPDLGFLTSPIVSPEVSTTSKQAHDPNLDLIPKKIMCDPNLLLTACPSYASAEGTQQEEREDGSMDEGEDQRVRTKPTDTQPEKDPNIDFTRFQMTRVDRLKKRMKLWVIIKVDGRPVNPRSLPQLLLGELENQLCSNSSHSFDQVGKVFANYTQFIQKRVMDNWVFREVLPDANFVFSKDERRNYRRYVTSLVGKHIEMHFMIHDFTKATNNADIDLRSSESSGVKAQETSIHCQAHHWTLHVKPVGFFRAIWDRLTGSRAGEIAYQGSYNHDWTKTIQSSYVCTTGADVDSNVKTALIRSVRMVNINDDPDCRNNPWASAFVYKFYQEKTQAEGGFYPSPQSVKGF